MSSVTALKYEFQPCQVGLACRPAAGSGGAPSSSSVALQAGLWICTALAMGEAVEVGRIAGCVFLAIVSVAAALGFLVYGGRLFLMLRRFPVESRGRTKKLREVRRCCCCSTHDLVEIVACVQSWMLLLLLHAEQLRRRGLTCIAA